MERETYSEMIDREIENLMTKIMDREEKGLRQRQTWRRLLTRPRDDHGLFLRIRRGIVAPSQQDERIEILSLVT